MTAALQGLLTKWNMQQDLVVRHILDSLTVEEMKERKMVGGSQNDVCSAFKHRWKLDPTQEKTLRGLPHKDLRYVLNEFDGTLPLEDVIAQAAEAEVEESC